MSGELRIASATGGTVYGHILNGSSQRWNGSAFETYTPANYDDYGITMTEQGSSGVYVGDFPVAITDDAEYSIIYYSREGASQAEGDPIVGTGTISWDGDSVAEDEDSVTGEMTGLEWDEYILRTFIRTDKQAELFDATNAAIAEIRRKFTTQRDEVERTITDTIDSLGQYKLDLESDFGNFVSDVFIRDSGDGMYLNKISKAEFDRRYSKWGTGDSERGRPRDFCVFGGQVLLGPIPDSLSYVYVMSFGRANTAPVTVASGSVPYTTEDYKEGLQFGTLFRLYAGIENDDQAGKWKAFWDNFLSEMETKEKRAKQGVAVVAYNDL